MTLTKPKRSQSRVKTRSNHKAFVPVKPVVPVSGAKMALAKLMQSVQDFDLAVWSGEVTPPERSRK